MIRTRIILLASLLSILTLQTAAETTEGRLATQENHEEGVIEYRGLVHDSLGDAILSLVADTLEVSNIGGSGADGVQVELQLDPPVEWFSSFDPIEISSPGSFVRLQNVGDLRAEGGPGVLSSIEFTESIDELMIDVDFAALGSPNYHLELFLNGDLVAEFSDLSGTVGSITGFTSDLLALPFWPAEVIFRCTDFILRPGDIWVTRWRAPVDFRSQSGDVLEIDGMSISAEDPQILPQHVDSIELLLANIPTLVITDAGVSASIFIDGFESGDTSAWSARSPN